MKTCSKCGVSKPVNEYSFVHPRLRNNKLRPDCKECVRKRTQIYCAANHEAQKRRMLKVRKIACSRARNFRQGYISFFSCADCGEDDSIVLDFDHVRGGKVCDISRMVASGFRIWKIVRELEKCVVRCANCHRRITKKRRETSVKVARMASNH